MKFERFDRKKVVTIGIVVSVSLALLFGVYSGLAYSRVPVTTRAVYSTLYMEEAHFTHSGIFSNESLYLNGSSHEYYPSKITRIILGNYTFSTSPPARGTYEIVLHTDYYVSSGKKKVYIFRETSPIGNGTFEGSFAVPLEFNMGELDKSLGTVREGTGLYRAEREVYVTIRVLVGNREPFTQEIRLNRDSSGMFYLTGTDKEYKKTVRTVNTTINSLSFAGSDVGISTARTLFPAMALFFSIPPVGFVYAKRGRKGKLGELKGLDKYIVEGTPSKERRIELASPKDLESVFELVDKPIIHYRDGGTDVYVIADGETVYEYRAL